MEYPDILLNVISGVTLRVILDEIDIRINRLTKADYLPQSGGHRPIHWRTE